MTPVMYAITGILSSYGEMEHMRAGRAEFTPFDPNAKQPKMSYKVRNEAKLLAGRHASFDAKRRDIILRLHIICQPSANNIQLYWNRTAIKSSILC